MKRGSERLALHQYHAIIRLVFALAVGCGSSGQYVRRRANIASRLLLVVSRRAPREQHLQRLQRINLPSSRMLLPSRYRWATRLLR
jgi:hypothetical protein